MKHDDCDEDFWFFMWLTNAAPALGLVVGFVLLVCWLMQWANS